MVGWLAGWLTHWRAAGWGVGWLAVSFFGRFGAWCVCGLNVVGFGFVSSSCSGSLSVLEAVSQFPNALTRTTAESQRGSLDTWISSDRYPPTGEVGRLLLTCSPAWLIMLNCKCCLVWSPRNPFPAVVRLHGGRALTSQYRCTGSFQLASSPRATASAIESLCALWCALATLLIISEYVPRSHDGLLWPWQLNSLRSWSPTSLVPWLSDRSWRSRAQAKTGHLPD